MPVLVLSSPYARLAAQPSRLVDDAQRFETGRSCPASSGRLALRVVEVGRDGDDRLLDLGAQIGFLQSPFISWNESGNLRWRIGLALGLDPGVAVGGAPRSYRERASCPSPPSGRGAPADQALDRENSALRLADRLALGRLADEPLATVGSDNGRRGAAFSSAFSITFGVLPSITATQEFVVPKSIPMTLAMVCNPLFLCQVGLDQLAPLKSDPRRFPSHRPADFPGQNPWLI